MPTLKPKAGAVSYRFQRYYPTLQCGHYLVTKSKRQDPVRVFFQQGDIDGACGIHVFAAVMVIFDLAKSIALQNMPLRKFGVPAEVWAAFQHTFFTGVHAAEFVQLIQSLNLPLNLSLRESREQCGLDRWVIDSLMAGQLVALVTANAKNPKFGKHWTLAVGVEGNVTGRDVRPDTMLLLDPSASQPNYKPHNSRLSVPLVGTGSRAGKSAKQLYKPVKDTSRDKPIEWLYESGDFAAEPVRIISAVRFRRADWF